MKSSLLIFSSTTQVEIFPFTIPLPLQRMEIAGLTARATSFIRRLQSHPCIFSQFKQVMKDYSTDKLNAGGVVSELDILFQNHPDFLNEYRIFLSPRLRATLPPPRQSPNKKCVIEPDMEILKPRIDFVNKVQKRFADEQGIFVEYLEIMRKLTQGKIYNIEAYNAIVKIFGKENQDLVDGFEWLVLGRKETKKKKKEKSSSCNNNNSGDEIKAPNQISNEMEDEMYELDINFFHRKTTVDSAKRLMNSLEEEQNQIINIDNYFRPVSLGYIKKVYKEEDSNIIKRLREDPTSVLPKILEKLGRFDEHEKKKNPVTKSLA